MEYVGIQTQKSRNNFCTGLLLFLFPCLVAALVLAFCFLMTGMSSYEYEDISVSQAALYMFAGTIPYVAGVIILWFVIAYFTNAAIIRDATGSKPLERKENKRVYNMVENLCMAAGMPMPAVNVIEDGSLNAFASGINRKSYTVTLSRGIIDKLDDAELEAVIAHELSHIRNNDVRLLIVSIVFVGIFSLIAQMALRALVRMPVNRSSKDKGGTMIFVVLALAVLAGIGYFFSLLMRFAISRKREYMADAGAAEMIRNPLALADALRKISGDPDIEAVTRNDVAQLFIHHPIRKNRKNSLFSTHPPIEKRIAILEQF